jgi:D-3-phosphoglycerate dehydrogenase
VLGASHPLLALDNAVCTPHIGYVERRGYERIFGNIFDQIAAFAAGQPINMVNPEVLKAAPR